MPPLFSVVADGAPPTRRSGSTTAIGACLTVSIASAAPLKVMMVFARTDQNPLQFGPTTITPWVRPPLRPGARWTSPAFAGILEAGAEDDRVADALSGRTPRSSPATVCAGVITSAMSGTSGSSAHGLVGLQPLDLRDCCGLTGYTAPAKPCFRRFFTSRLRGEPAWGEAPTMATLRGWRPREGVGAIHQFGVWKNLVDQADAFSLASLDPVAAPEQFQRLGRADNARQADRRRRPRE
jgi:hypothetical protein